MRLSLILSSLLLAGSAVAADQSSRTAIAQSDLIGLDGKSAGIMTLQKTPSGHALIKISAGGLVEGWHGVHIHEMGNCDAGAQFKSAGEHLSGGHNHGVYAENGPHIGDLPNQLVGSEGGLETEIFADKALFPKEGESPLFDKDGSAIVIHAKADDYESQPSGDAGDRVLCGIIKKAGE